MPLDDVSAQTDTIPRELIDRIKQIDAEFDELCLQRHIAGSKKYGPGKFLAVDTMQEALEEIADLSNYARYTFIKVRLLQDRIAQEDRPDFQKEMTT